MCIETDDVVVKAQVLAGGRGKGVFDSGLQGGVQIVSSAEEVRELAKKMIGRNLITKQTGATGRPCNSVMIVERLYSRKDFYLAILLDRISNGIMLMGSRRGGMDIEAVAAEDPAAIITTPLPFSSEEQIDRAALCRFARRIGISEANVEGTVDIIDKMLRLFREKDATLLEINPFVETVEGKMVCLDAKINFDDNAEFRQSEVFAMRDSTQEDQREVKAAEQKLNYIGLDGHIGCLVNGAGLAMATMDIIKLHGGEPANFLDVGGSATAEQVEGAIKILGDDPSVKAILVNIFGGIMRCDVIAQGIVNAVRRQAFDIPIVVRLLGTNIKEAKKIMSKGDLDVFSCDDLDESAKKAVLLSKIIELGEDAGIHVFIKDPKGKA